MEDQDQGCPEDEPQLAAAPRRGLPDWSDLPEPDFDSSPWPELRRLFGYE
jgi:hypothetical protein